MNPAVMVALGLLSGSSDPGGGVSVIVQQRGIFRFVFSCIFGRVN